MCASRRSTPGNSRTSPRTIQPPPCKLSSPCSSRWDCQPKTWRSRSPTRSRHRPTVCRGGRAPARRRGGGDPPLVGARAGPGPPQRVRGPQSPGGLRQRRPRWGARPSADRRTLPAAPAVQLERRRGPTGDGRARSRTGRVGPRATGDRSRAGAGTARVRAGAGTPRARSAAAVERGSRRGDVAAGVRRGRGRAAQRTRGPPQRPRGARPLRRRRRGGERRRSGRSAPHRNGVAMTAGTCLVAAALALAACRSERQAAAADTPPSEQTVGGVGTAVTTKQSFPQVVRAIGTVTARPGHFAELSAPAPTRVARIFVAPGQRVAEGDSLVEFERAPFDAAARSAETALASAERAYARAVRLAQAGILPQKDSDQAAADLAQAQVAAITARRAQQLATLRAPLAGVVTRMTAVLGAAVDANQPLVEVADVASLDVVFNVSPSQAAQIHAGDSVHVTAGEG